MKGSRASTTITVATVAALEIGLLLASQTRAATFIYCTDFAWFPNGNTSASTLVSPASGSGPALELTVSVTSGQVETRNSEIVIGDLLQGIDPVFSLTFQSELTDVSYTDARLDIVDLDASFERLTNLIPFPDSVGGDLVIQGENVRALSDNSNGYLMYADITATAGLSFKFVENASALAIPHFTVQATGIPPILVGDYNANGVVDAADYTIWRDTLGSTTDLQANGDDTGASAGVIDGADYALWKLHFGQTAGSGAGAGSSSKAAVPEPLSGALLVTILAAVARNRSALPRMTPHRKFERLP